MLKNLVFDFGNVLVVFKPEEHLRKYVQNDEEAMELRNLIWESKPWKDADIGIGGRQETFERLCEMYPEKKELFREILFECSSWLVIPEEVKDVLHRLARAGYNLYYISNTNPMDYETMMSMHPILHELNGGLASYQERLLKPDPAIYQLLLDRYSLKADECLFVDDMSVNTEAAEKLGYHTLTLTTGAATLETALRTIPEIDRALMDS